MFSTNVNFNFEYLICCIYLSFVLAKIDLLVTFISTLMAELDSGFTVRHFHRDKIRITKMACGSTIKKNALSYIHSSRWDFLEHSHRSHLPISTINYLSCKRLGCAKQLLFGDTDIAAYM